MSAVLQPGRQVPDTRARFLAGKPHPFDFEGETFHVLPLTADAFKVIAPVLDRVMKDDGDEPDIEAVLEFGRIASCYCLCEPDGTRVFSDDEMEAAGAAPFKRLQAVAEEVMAISGFGDDDSGN